MLFAIAVMNGITGLVAVAVLAPLSFGADAEAYRRGALAVAGGTYDKDFLYSPLAGALLTPLTWAPETVAAVLMTAVGAVILAAGIAVETRQLRAIDRALVAVAAFGFLPVVNELLLGQTTLLFAAALWLIGRPADRAVSGVPFGVLMALAPKPALLGILLWMLVWRRRALVGMVTSAVVVGLLGVLLMGVDAHVHWLSVLTRAGTLARNGNVSLWVGGVTPLVVGVAGVVAIVTLVVVWRSEQAGLPAVLLAGLLLAPYTLIYSVTILLVAVPWSEKVSPRLTRALAFVANPGLLGVPAFWLAAWLAALIGTVARPQPVPVTTSRAPAPLDCSRCPTTR